MSTKSPKSSMGAKAGVQDEVAPIVNTSGLSAMQRAARRGYPIDPAGRKQSIDLCKSVMRSKKCNSRTKLMAVKALAALDQLELRDAHHFESMQHESGILDLRMRRAEEGKPNDCVSVQVTPVRELPLPATMQGYRRRVLDEPSGN